MMEDLSIYYREAMKIEETPKPVICPRTFGESCILCEKIGLKYNEIYKGVIASELPNYDRKLRGILYSWDRVGKKYLYPEPIRMVARRMKATIYYYANVYIPSENEVVVLRFTNSLFQPLIKHTIDKSSDYYGFWDPDNGTNFVITKDASKPDFPLYIPVFRRHSSAISPSILKKVYDLSLDKLIRVLESDDDSYPIFPQNKIDKTLEVRILPYSKKQPEKWFERVYQHFNIERSTFDEVLHGDYDPFADMDSDKELDEDNDQFTVGEPKSAMKLSDESETPKKAEPKRKKLVEPYPVDDTPITRPDCFGSYDPKDLACSPKGGCKHIRDCKLTAEDDIPF